MRRTVILAVLVPLLTTRAWPSDGPTQESESKPAENEAIPAGACAIDVAPTTFPVLVNGGFLQNSANRLNDPIRAKCLVLDDGSTRLAIVVVDSCMMPRELLDRAKELAHEKTGIPTDRILISATHTHSAPAAMGALGCPADADYVAHSAGDGSPSRSNARPSSSSRPASAGM